MLKKVTLLPFDVEYPSLGGEAGPSVILYAQDVQSAMVAADKYAVLFLDAEPGESVSVQEITLDIS